MLPIPTKGFRRSIAKHNVKMDMFCDWIESSIIFKEDEFSSSDVVDNIIEEEIYEEQDFAWEFVENAWNELERRLSCIGEYAPYQLNGKRLSRCHEWRNRSAYSFCIALLLAKNYPGWASSFGNDYTDQGMLFERLVEESLKNLFPDWSVHSTGWSPNNPVTIKIVANQVSSLLGEHQGNITLWTDECAKEEGLDLFLYRSFSDRRVGIPVYLMQCASGRDWDEKLKTPDLELWEKIILFAAKPRKAFAMPFVLLDDQFRKKCNLVNGLLMDRCRILEANCGDYEWISESLQDDIKGWLEPRIEALLRL